MAREADERRAAEAARAAQLHAEAEASEARRVEQARRDREHAAGQKATRDVRYAARKSRQNQAAGRDLTGRHRATSANRQVRGSAKIKVLESVS